MIVPRMQEQRAGFGVEVEQVDRTFAGIDQSANIFPLANAVNDHAAILRARGTEVKGGGEREGEDGGVVAP